MWSPLALFVLVSVAAADFGWTENKEYVYQVTGRTLTGLHEVADEYSGITLRARLVIRPTSGNVLLAKISNAEYAQVHANLPGGWNSKIADGKLSYKQLPLTEQPFKILLKNGVVRDLVVSQQMPNWEANFIKSFVSQLQLDTQAENLVKSRMNQLPEEDSYSAVFKTMEDTVTGKYETLYDISPLPKYVLQSQPWLAPFPEMKGNGEIIEIVKNKNFSRSDELVGYHLGLGEMGRFEPSTNQMGKFFSRSSISRAVVCGTLKRFTIQSSTTTNEIIVKPTLNSKQNGLVVSQLNLTLAAVQDASSQFPQLSQPQNLGSLIYRYDRPFAGSNEVRPGQQQQREENLSSPYGSSSSSSSSASQENQQRINRPRRSAFSSATASSSSSSSSDSFSSVSSEEYWQQEQPKLNSPPETPLLPYYVGYKGQSIKNSQNFDVVKVVQKICQQIGQELESPEEIPKQETLAKFTTLSALTRIMTEEEMQRVAHEVYTKEKYNVKSNIWRVYRDAVAECGTGPALLTIQDWIQTLKIRGEEAAEVVATMAAVVRQPTEEYMRAFYALVTRPEVQSQAILNDTLVLSYSTLVRKVYVSGHESHNQYPVHSFGSFRTKSGKQFVVKEYIPYLSKQLDKCIEDADSHKTLVYIRALGNVAHQQTLNAFEPYLEGRKQVSQFQRLQMVIALDKLCKIEPKVARSVLYKIYQNAGEEEEIRVAAVYQLMRTSPPSSMLQRMAEYTNVDTAEYVNAAVQSAIRTAAKLQGNEFNELCTNARSAEPFLTRKVYGAQYSHDLLHSYVVREMDLVYKQTVQTIGGEDCYLPKGIKYALRATIGGARRQFIIAQAVVSSIDELTNVFEQQTESYKLYQKQKQQAQQSEQSQWSSDFIARKLNIQRHEREQLEGAFLLKLGEAERYFTFNNQTIEMLPQIVNEIEKILRSGQQFLYTKLINRREIAISFPTEMSLPFIYTLDNPTLLAIKAKVNAAAEPKISNGQYLQKPNTLKVDAQIQSVISSKVQNQLGFVTPFDHQQYCSGYDKAVQVNLALKSIVEVDIQNRQLSAQVQPIEPNKNARLFYYSTRPYTSRHDLLQVQPIANSQHNQIIYSKPQYSFHKTVGQQTGLAFHIDYTSEQRFMDARWIYEQARRHNLISAVMGSFYDETIQYTECSIYYQADQSSAKQVQIHMGYQHKYQSQQENSANPDLSQFEKLPQESKSRQEQFARMASSKINNAKVTVGDVCIEFQGQQKVKYVMTAAYARSAVHTKSQILFFFNRQSAIPQAKPYQIAVAVKSDKPNTSGLNFLYALKFDPTTTSQMQIAFGEDYQRSAKVNVHAQLRKSESRKQYLLSLPEAQQCRQEMQQGNHQLPACANLTLSANLLDHISVKVQYENVTPKARNYTQRIYNAVRYMGYFNLEENTVNPQENKKQNEFDVEARFDNDLRGLNVSIHGEKLAAHFNNIRINDWVRRFVVLHPVFPVQSRVLGRVLGLRTYRPICVVDQQDAVTFNNKTYPINIGNTWTVAFQYLPQYARYHYQQQQQHDQRKEQQVEEYVVLVRESQSRRKNKEVRLSIRSPKSNGKLIEVELKPSGQSGSCTGSNPCAQVSVNQKQYKYDDKQVTVVEDRLIRFHALPNGEVKMEIENDFYIIYDGERIKITVTTDKFRGDIRGLCGTYNGKAATDFTTPQNCILRNPYEFAATYAVEQNGKVQQLQAQATKSQCYYDEKIYANVISDYDAGRVHAGKQEKRQSQHSVGGCTRHQTRYVKDDSSNSICFTLRPFPVCRNQCRAEMHITKNVPVHCVAKNSVSEHWKTQIKKGASPDFSLKTPNKYLDIEIPQRCMP